LGVVQQGLIVVRWSIGALKPAERPFFVSGHGRVPGRPSGSG
jgi:hypothetical protein